MRLLQFPYSPFAAKVRICLGAKQLDCELVDVPYLDRRELVALTGKVMIPVLVDGDRVIEDSPRITAYLDERYGPSLRAGPLGSLTVTLEQWADQTLEDSTFRLACPGLVSLIGTWDPGRELEAKAMFSLVKERRYGTGCIAEWKRDEARYTAKVIELLAPLSRAVEQRPFMLGDSLSLADAAVAGQLVMVEAALPGWLAKHVPGLTSWFARCQATSSPSSRPASSTRS